MHIDQLFNIAHRKALKYKRTKDNFRHKNTEDGIGKRRKLSMSPKKGNNIHNNGKVNVLSSKGMYL